MHSCDALAIQVHPTDRPLCRGRGRGGPLRTLRRYSSLLAPSVSKRSLFFPSRRTWNIISRARIQQASLPQSVATCSLPTPAPHLRALGHGADEPCTKLVARRSPRGLRSATVRAWPPPRGSLPAGPSTAAVPRPAHQGDTDPWTPPILISTHTYSFTRVVERRLRFPKVAGRDLTPTNGNGVQPRSEESPRVSGPQMS